LPPPLCRRRGLAAPGAGHGSRLRRDRPRATKRSSALRLPITRRPGFARVFERYGRRPAADPTCARAPHRPCFPLVTGVEPRLYLGQPPSGATASPVTATASNGQGGVQQFAHRRAPPWTATRTARPTFYVPEAAGYPRFFRHFLSRGRLPGRKTRRRHGHHGGRGLTGYRLNGPVLMLFSQASARAAVASRQQFTAFPRR